MSLRAFPVILMVLSLSTVDRAQADLIDFEQFNPGDGLTEINAFYNPLGIQFLTDGGVGTIQTVGGSKVFGAFTPDANQFDILVNFSYQIDDISADFLDNGGPAATFSVLEGYDNHKVPTSDTSGFQFSVFGNANVNLAWSYPGPGSASPVRTLHFTQDLATNDFVTIDNIQFRAIPEPGSALLLVITAGTGLALRWTGRKGMSGR